MTKQQFPHTATEICQGLTPPKLSRPLVLASASPRRKELLQALGLPFIAVAPHIDEDPNPLQTAQATAMRLSEEKALIIADKYPDHIVIGADTLVTSNGIILGKPCSRRHAETLFTRHLNGSFHRVITGVTLACLGAKKTVKWVSETRIKFKRFTPREIQKLFAEAISPTDKAGGYAIQEDGEKLVSEYDGFYSTVVGLPMEDLIKQLKKFEKDT